MAYRVGQVVYVILNKETKVYPMQVVEEITKKTLAGDSIIYMVRAGSKEGEVIQMGDIDGEVFDSSAKAKAVLMDRVSASINRIIDQAVAKAREWYPNGTEHSEDDTLASVRKQPAPAAPKAKKQAAPRTETAQLASELAVEAETAIVELGDGTKARVRMPNAL